MSKNFLRIGQGFDSHRLEPNRDLILGGIKIPHEKGLAGHSDADVLTHAIIDALLGASNLGDIGEHFPPSDPQFKDANSIAMLQKIIFLLKANRWEICNLDAVIVCEKPKISPFKAQIIHSLAAAMQVLPEQISLKGKTAEKMGALGREEGIAVIAVALLQKQVPH